MTERFSDSNHTLRFPRSYQEATGKRLHARDFESEYPRVSKREALVWLSVVVSLMIVGYIFIPY